MKVVILTCCLFALTTAFPADPNDEVELVPVESTNAEEDIGSGGNVPVIVIRTSSGSGGSPFGAFPSLFNTFFGNGNTRSGSAGEGESGTFFPFGLLPGFDTEVGVPEVDTDALFPKVDIGQGGGDEESEDGVVQEESCNLMCLLFKSLGNRVKHIEDEIKELQKNKENEVEGGGESQPETTYEEKVLDDGTIVRINKTRYSDVSEDGSSYFGFHSTSFVSNVNSNNENKQDEDAEESSGGEGENADEVKIIEETTTASREVVDKDYGVDEEDKKPIKLVKKNDSVRRKRSDPFNQQTVDSSYLNEVRQEKLIQLPSNGWKQEQQQRSYDAFRDDTRVNDLLLENTRRGGYVRTEPDAEFLQDY